jgi:alanine racemase
MPMTELSWLEINLSRLEANASTLRRILTRPARRSPTRLCAVVKADAYGLGLAPIAQSLAAAGVDMFAVYSPTEARELLQHHIRQPVLILKPLREIPPGDPLSDPAASGQLHLTIHDPDQLASLNRLGQTLGSRLPIHLFIDTGMSRSGLSHQQIQPILRSLHAWPNLRLVGLMSHLASADSDHGYAQHQLQRFNQLIHQHQPLLAPHQLLTHIANTSATFLGPQYHGNMVRVGLGLWGYGQDSDPFTYPKKHDDPHTPQLLPVVRWRSRIDHLQTYPQGAAVGYHCTHRLQRDSVLGIVPVGYSKGYPLSLSNQAVVRVFDHADQPLLDAPILGRVSMDQIIIDLTDSRSLADRPTLGSLVELISDQPDSPCALPRLAQLAGSTSYEMLCRLSPSLPRRYLRSAPRVTEEQNVTIVAPTTAHARR